MKQTITTGFLTVCGYHYLSFLCSHQLIKAIHSRLKVFNDIRRQHIGVRQTVQIGKNQNRALERLLEMKKPVSENISADRFS